jgi:hypothetical protein
MKFQKSHSIVRPSTAYVESPYGKKYLKYKVLLDILSDQNNLEIWSFFRESPFLRCSSRHGQ